MPVRPPRLQIRVQSALIPVQTQPHRPSDIIGNGVWGASATDGIWMVSSPKFSSVGIVLFVRAADQLSKNIVLPLSSASGDGGSAIVTIRKPRLIKSDLCANG